MVVGSGKWRFLLIFGAMLGVIALFLTLTLTIVIYWGSLDSSDSEGISYRYKYYEVNPKEKTSTLGFVELGKELKEHDFISMQYWGTDKHYIISNFGETHPRYSCTGTCSCSASEDERRLSTGILTRPLFYLLLASSSILAYDLSKKHFAEECREVLKEEGVDCAVEAINVDDVSCSSSSCSSDSDSTSTDSSGSGEAEEDLEEHTFNCIGKCLDPMDLFTIKNEKLRDLVKSLNCRGMENEGLVFLDFPYGEDQQMKYRAARKDFTVDYMNKFCEETSKSITDPETGKELKCKGSTDGVSSFLIDCVQVDPPPDENVCRIS